MNATELKSPTLTARNVVLARNGKDFARLPDFDLAAGQTIALVGASGSGKTTALIALAGVRAPSTGTISIEGTDLWQLGSHARDGFRGRRIGLIFQSFYLVDALTVGANIWLAAQCAGYPVNEPDRLHRLLERLGISDIKRRRADRISHGQAQRVAVARALLNRPAIVLADEPTSALDDDNTEALLALLTASAASEKAALIVATHDRRVLNTISNVIEMERLS